MWNETQEHAALLTFFWSMVAFSAKPSLVWLSLFWPVERFWDSFRSLMLSLSISLCWGVTKHKDYQILSTLSFRRVISFGVWRHHTHQKAQRLQQGLEVIWPGQSLCPTRHLKVPVHLVRVDATQPDRSLQGFNRHGSWCHTRKHIIVGHIL